MQRPVAQALRVATVLAGRRRVHIGTGAEQQPNHRQIPTAHREYANDTFGERGGCGFTFGNGCSGDSPADLFGQRKTTTYAVHPNRQEKSLEVVE